MIDDCTKNTNTYVVTINSDIFICVAIKSDISLFVEVTTTNMTPDPIFYETLSRLQSTGHREKPGWRLGSKIEEPLFLLRCVTCYKRRK
jgi:hypothetical protein